MEVDTQDPPQSKYCTLKEDPIFLLTLMDKYVKIHMIKNTSYEGFILSIDPLSHSIFLAVPKEDAFQTILIPGHAIIDLTEHSTQFKPPIRQESVPNSDQDSLNKKRLVSWFKLNKLPVTEVDNIVVVDSVRVLPPYTGMDIYTESPVVALQIKRLMEKMPEEYDPK